ncbi:MAG TPA: trypsin-like peptidase domain-containing protein [Gaiellaceae bacterium]|nr:trypsin-like peptidase domain-containing protein [Gaiellaceae bacterium]
MRTALIALLCGLLGAGVALGISVGAGLVGSSTTTVERVVQDAAAGTAPPAAAASTTGGGFDAARVYAERSPGVVTVVAYIGGAGSQGSGFVVDRAGSILTNAHVITNAGETSGAVRGASSVYVEFADGDRVPARIVGWDVFDDVGVLRVDPAAHALVPVPLGRSAAAVVGEPVAAIGSPLGNADSLAVGVVSAVHRSIAALTARFDLTDAIQTDAPLAHGSSGGPLLDGRGRVIGINAQIRSDQSGSSGIGFAVPIDSARRSLHELLTKGRVAYAYAGIQAQDLTPSLAEHLHLDVRRGALVDHVVAGGPADRAGIRGGGRQESFLGEAVVVGGDVIVRVGSRRVADAGDLVRVVTNDLRPNTTVRVQLVRGGRTRTLALRLAERPAR